MILKSEFGRGKAFSWILDGKRDQHRVSTHHLLGLLVQPVLVQDNPSAELAEHSRALPAVPSPTPIAALGLLTN